MARKGRKPKPTRLKVIEGNPGKRPLNKNEPKPKPVAPEPPYWLKKDKTAYKEWKRVVPELDRLGLITTIDGAAIEAYCMIYSRWAKSERKIQKEGLTTTNIRNGTKPIPEVQIARDCLNLLKAYAAEFGLTPSSRGRLSLPSGEVEDPMEEILASVK